MLTAAEQPSSKDSPARGPTLVVAGRSARLMAEAAQRDGYRVIALDAFGDTDTRHAASAWHAVGTATGGPLDSVRVLQALREAADAERPIGWVAGSDFECEPELLAAGATLLPLIGTAPGAVQRVRDPSTFFAELQRLGLPHPETRLDAPADAIGWLRKLGRGCGGWHIRRAEHAPPVDADRQPYFQREAPGRPMSALFVAHRRGHRLIGLNALIVRPLGAHPHVYRGAVGPVALPAAAQRSLASAIDALTDAFALRGLCSIDFLWHDGACSLLEINPRPSASMALYPDLPLMRWHVEACLPAASVTEASETPGGPCRGIETVFARTAFQLTAAQATALQARGDCHDLPAAGSAFAAGDPVCSLSATGNNAVQVREKLATERQMLRAAWSAAPSPP